jgi:hypothetical protein
MQSRLFALLGASNEFDHACRSILQPFATATPPPANRNLSAREDLNAKLSKSTSSIQAQPAPYTCVDRAGTLSVDEPLTAPTAQLTASSQVSAGEGQEPAGPSAAKRRKCAT